MTDDRKFDAAEAELERRRRRAVVAWGEEHGRLYKRTYAVEDQAGRPVGMTEVVMGACFVDEAAPDHAGDN